MVSFAPLKTRSVPAAGERPQAFFAELILLWGLSALFRYPRLFLPLFRLEFDPFQADTYSILLY
jgi:hypothetical protein